MTILTRIANRPDALADVIAVIDRDGGVIVEDFISQETLAALKQDLLPLVAAVDTGKDDFFGKRTRRLSNLFAHTRHCAGIVTHPLFLEAAKHFICVPRKVWSGDEQMTSSCDVQIGVGQVIQIGPGEGAQPIHRDDGAFMWSRSYGREARLQIMIALSDFTRENGGTLVIPGSHKWDDDRPPVMSDVVSTEMKAGSALLFLGGTFHAGGQNRTSGELRTGLTIALDASNVRQEENLYLSLAPERVAEFPEQVQRLLGWSTSGRSLGWIEIDGIQSDPNELLARLNPASAAALA
ncbi:phytanoyl-CoA dioxygenase family protein [Sphingomonas sp. CL5.1]|uniref:phytanoyl-CoA dioxygenase family protein n=1 Tax=Sphingomonas sp. CL5.1 TaxID=2653203 RepID=UPI00158337B5|nr:phytanoyl-CoA dioxygenase family protein [Sphingomonas sp. CL5.1]QKR99873.1 phytanoyl-CoA dioxygenase family protein [Sphingomonas sp. CL5.1]